MIVNCKKCTLQFVKTKGNVCKPCIAEWHKAHFQKVKEKHQSQSRLWRANNLEKAREMDLKSRLKTTYGITLGEYKEMLEHQNNRCAVCKSDSFKRKNAHNFFVDHDHKTGRIRGLLCHRCNLAAGWVEDNSLILNNLVDYLK